MDALDRVKSRPWSKEKKKEYAIQKAGEEEASLMKDKDAVTKTSNKFREHVAQARKRLGLPPLEE
jgi:hypothetical protein